MNGSAEKAYENWEIKGIKVQKKKKNGTQRNENTQREICTGLYYEMYVYPSSKDAPPRLLRMLPFPSLLTKL